MKTLKNWLSELLRNPSMAFLIAALINILILGTDQVFTSMHLPEMASESDNLSITQILIGFMLSHIKLVLLILSPIFSLLFGVSLGYLMYRIIRPPKY